MASKCWCCPSNASTESIDHIFLRSEYATTTFQYLCPLFSKARPNTMQQLLYDWGINVPLDNFYDCMGFGIISCCLWEIWNLRNQSTYDNQSGRFTKYSIFWWAKALSKTIKYPVIYNQKAKRMCEAFQLNSSFSPYSGRQVWYPCTLGNTCNLAININDRESSMAAVIRAKDSSFVCALKVTSFSKSFLRCLHHIINELDGYGIVFSCLRSSNSEISTLSIPDGWFSYRIRKRLLDRFKNIKIFKVCNSLNKSADALSWCRSHGFFRSFNDLPKVVQKAMEHDSLPHECSFGEVLVYANAFS